MLKTVEAEISPDGTVTLLEPVEVSKTTRALVTVMENGGQEGNLTNVLMVLDDEAFADRPSYSPGEIEAQIEEARTSWE